MSAAHKRVAGAFLVGVSLIGLAWYLSRPTTPVADSTLAVVASEAAPRGHITVTDEDNDGIPDWQEALQRTEPVLIEPVGEYEPPDTLTGEFALRFFEDMMLSEHYNTFNGDPEKLAEIAAGEMQNLAEDTPYTAADVTNTVDDSKLAIRNYANAIALIVLNQPVPEGAVSELEIIKRAYDTNNPDVLLELEPFIKSYNIMVAQLESVPVPTSYVGLHVDMLNVFNAIRNDITAMQSAFTDPLLTIVRLKRFEEDASGLIVAFTNLQKQIVADEIDFVSTDPVWQLVSP